MEGPENKVYYTVPTITALSVILVPLAWQCEFLELLLTALGRHKFDAAAQTALLAVSIGLTLFAHIRGKKEFRKIAQCGGTVVLTRFQTILVVGSLFLFVGILVAILPRLFGWD